MPDHIHAVIQLGSKQTLSRLIQSFKSHTAKQINAGLGRSGAIWQPAYHDHGIRRDESLNAIIQYCYQNPVRSGLVKAARDYPFWRCKFEMRNIARQKIASTARSYRRGVSVGGLPAAVRIGYCGMSVAFICFAQACRSVSNGELTAPSCVMPCCSYCCSVA